MWSLFRSHRNGFSVGSRRLATDQPGPQHEPSPCNTCLRHTHAPSIGPRVDYLEMVLEQRGSAVVAHPVRISTHGILPLAVFLLIQYDAPAEPTPVAGCADRKSTRLNSSH